MFCRSLLLLGLWLGCCLRLDNLCLLGCLLGRRLALRLGALLVFVERLDIGRLLLAQRILDDLATLNKRDTARLRLARLGRLERLAQTRHTAQRNRHQIVTTRVFHKRLHRVVQATRVGLEVATQHSDSAAARNFVRRTRLLRGNNDLGRL